jgi:predicted ArsR family transcriptional regulator
MAIRDKYDRDYIARHEHIVNKLVEMVDKSGSGCVSVTKIADELGMDKRTVKAHLKIIEVNHAGVFADTTEKQFCTREGITLLAKRLGLIKTDDEQQS